MRFTLFAAAAMVALGQPVYAQDTAQKNAENADTQGQMEADGKKTQSGAQDKSDAKSATAEASHHVSRRPGANGGGMNANAGQNNGRGQDELDPIRGPAIGQP
jgi:hypothetical protein